MSFINPQTRKTISEELLLAAQEIAKKHGLTVKLGNSVYDEATYKPKVEFEFPSIAQEKAEKTSKLYAPMLGLPEDIIGKSYVSKGKTYTVTGLNPSKPKNAIELLSSDGKAYMCSVVHIKAALGLIGGRS